MRSLRVLGRKAKTGLRLLRARALRTAVTDLRVPPPVLGYRALPTRPLRAEAERGGLFEEVHPGARARNAPPVNRSVESLPEDRGWWGYSFRDVPVRESGPTVLATVHDARVLPYVDPRDGQFYACIVTPDDHVLDLREMAFRRRHPELLRRGPARSLERATWILERVYHNHSHWLTAHLPKVLLSRSRGLLGETLLPGALTTPAIEASLGMLGIGDEAPRLDPVESLHVRELTLMATDRFRPELLGSVRDAFVGDAPRGRRRLYVSRRRASRRRLLSEEVVWDAFRRAGFERLDLETLPFEAQVERMAEAEVVVAPHGAGLSNIVFCPSGTTVVEIADLAFPNPNFYATAAALGHRYWVLPARMVGEGPPLARDLWLDPDEIEPLLAELEGAPA